MEAKDTVISDDQRKSFSLKAQMAVDDYYRENALGICPKMYGEAAQLCRDIAREELEAQAEISFKMGYNQALKEIKAGGK